MSTICILLFCLLLLASFSANSSIPTDYEAVAYLGLEFRSRVTSLSNLCEPNLPSSGKRVDTYISILCKSSCSSYCPP